MQVTGIFIYPIKATAAVRLEEAEVRPRGLAGDRRWVVIDEHGQFLHQRIHPELTGVKCSVAADGKLRIEASAVEPFSVVPSASTTRVTVTVWGDNIDAADAGEEAAKWFTQYLKFPCRLAYMDEISHRSARRPYARETDVVSFADAMPLLVCTEASLRDLNGRLQAPIPMDRFRPNVVVDGDAAWGEDKWRRLRIGDVEFEATHPSIRCVVTTTDQATGDRSPDGEPLKTLATFRNSPDGVRFGHNLVPRGSGTIRIGDRVRL